MAFSHRKMLASYHPRDCVNLTICVPCLRAYPPPPPPPPTLQQDFSLLVSTLICIIGSVLLFLVMFVFLYLYIMQSRRDSAATVAPSSNTNRRENEEEEETQDFHVWRISTIGLQRSTIDSITVVGFKKGEGIIEGTECSVCLNEFEEDESLRLLPKCSHAFHINCIDTWLLSHDNCPLCRAPILLTEPRHQETETNHQQDSGSNNDNSVEQESSGSRNLSRAQSDLANHCDSGNVETVRRSFLIGGSSSLKASDGDDDDDIASSSRRRHFYSSFSANFFSSSKRSSSTKSNAINVA